MKAFVASLLLLGLVLGGLAPAAAGDYMASPYSERMAPPVNCPPGWEAAYPQDEPRGEPSGELILFDVLILRPLGLAATVVGTAGAVLAAPWSCSDCEKGVSQWDLVERKLIREPAGYTFCRPLGGGVDY
ncbi:MAG: hypothetical protein MUF52_09320 [Syntrophobacteraceae bacterium]|jgi:hypothetical protein|nr:hypothetical protein [Syntrophobacteraceae bacterium]